MGADSKIEWTHHTANFWRGCVKVSPGCAHCYAETMSRRNPAVLGVWGPDGTRVVAAESYWRQPLAWDRAAAKAGERRRVFCASLADVFEDWTGQPVNTHGEPLWATPPGCPLRWMAGARRPNPDVRPLTLDDVRARLWRLILDTPHLDWLLLTKRPENAARWLDDNVYGPAEYGDWTSTGIGGEVVPNVWIGVSVEDQERADERIPHLLKVPAAVRFLSCEPLLGPIDLTAINSRLDDVAVVRGGVLGDTDGRSFSPRGAKGWGIHWCIVGGESGPGARPMHPAWARSIRDECAAAGVAFHFKQFGAWAPVGDDTPRGAALAYVHRSGGFTPAISGYEPGCPCDSMMSDEPMARVGKKASGRLLDGVTHDGFPEVPSHA